MYSKADYRIMKEQINVAIGEGADGLTIGANSPLSEIPDQELAALLSQIPEQTLLTFHRAFDLLNEPIRQLETIQSLGFHRILTSGGPGNAIENIQNLSEYQIHSPQGLHIVAAGGVRAEHIPGMKDKGISCFHAAAGGHEKDVLDPNVLKALQESIKGHAQ